MHLWDNLSLKKLPIMRAERNGDKIKRVHISFVLVAHECMYISTSISFFNFWSRWTAFSSESLRILQLSPIKFTMSASCQWFLTTLFVTGDMQSKLKWNVLCPKKSNTLFKAIYMSRLSARNRSKFKRTGKALLFIFLAVWLRYL